MPCGRHVPVSHRLVRDQTGRGRCPNNSRLPAGGAADPYAVGAELNELGPNSLRGRSAGAETGAVFVIEVIKVRHGVRFR